MVGVAVGTSAIAGVGFAGPFWGLAFALGGGVAGGTLALVSQRYGADAFDQLGVAVRASTVLVVVISVPVTVAFWLYPAELVSLLSDNRRAVEHGATYLQIVGLGIPLAGLNLVGSRTLVGVDDAYTAMQVRAGGAVANIGLNAVFIFGLEWGVAGAAVGTVLANVAVTAVFVVGLVSGSVPGIGRFPVQISPVGTYVDGETIRDLCRIGLPIGARNLVWTVAEFPMFAILDVFGESTVAAFVIARRIWALMNAPGWVRPRILESRRSSARSRRRADRDALRARYYSVFSRDVRRFGGARGDLRRTGRRPVRRGPNQPGDPDCRRPGLRRLRRRRLSGRRWRRSGSTRRKR